MTLSGCRRRLAHLSVDGKRTVDLANDGRCDALDLDTCFVNGGAGSAGASNWIIDIVIK